MNATEIKTNHTKYNLQSWSKQGGLNPIPVERGEGIYFWDYDGNRYTDMSSQLVNLNVGFGCRPIIDAIKEQAEKFCFVGPSYACESRSKLAEMVVGLMPDNIAKVFFTNGGADAGYVMKISASGSQGTIVMMVGVDANKAITGISVVSHSETSGIGTKVVGNELNAAGVPVLDQFVGMSGAGSLVVGKTVTPISGATVSTKGINMGANAALAVAEVLG